MGVVLEIMTRPAVMTAVLVWTALLSFVAITYGRRHGWPVSRTSAAVLAAVGWAIVPAVTLARRNVAGVPDTCVWDPTAWNGASEAVLNIALFMPAAFFSVLAARRAVLVAVVAVAVSLAIEVIQIAGDLGVCQSADLVRNSFGAVLAAALGRVVILVADRESDRPTVSGASKRP